MDWYEDTERYHEQTLDGEGDLSILSYEWQRELAAIWRLEADVNNGTYLQFIENWGLDAYKYAIQSLRKMGATTMARVIEECHQLVLDNTDSALSANERFCDLLPNPTVNADGSINHPGRSQLPDNIIERIYALSDEFMAYPDDIESLGTTYYGPLVADETR